MTTAEKYVTAAYAVFLAVLLLYIVIYAFRIARLQRQVDELSELATSRADREARQKPEQATVG